MRPLKPLFLAAVITASGAAFAQAQSVTTTGAGASSMSPGGSAAAGGTGGSAALNGMSASSLGVGATSTAPAGSSSSLAVGGSAAGGLKDKSRSGVHGHGSNLVGVSRDTARDHGTWTRSVTRTRDHKGTVTSRSMSAYHIPGSKPVRSTTTIGAGQ